MVDDPTLIAHIDEVAGKKNLTPHDYLAERLHSYFDI